MTAQQFDLFGGSVWKQPKKRAIKAPRITEKPSVTQRAGSHLTPGAKQQVYGPGKRGPGSKHGVIDVALRVYQHGGEKGNFIFRNKNLVTLSMPVWLDVRDKVDTIEMICHKDNYCYSLPMAIARDSGEPYNAGLGDRIGWPLPWWTITNAYGQVIQVGTVAR